MSTQVSVRRQLRLLRYNMAESLVAADNAEKLKEVRELFEYDYKRNSDQQFILNTPGIKIAQGQFELMEDDPQFDEDDYMQFISEIENERRSMILLNGQQVQEQTRPSSQTHPANAQRSNLDNDRESLCTTHQSAACAEQGANDKTAPRTV